MTDTNGLHLPDLAIKGFRGIDKLSIPRLGRVTLLAGKNGVGKSTVLDAVRVYAARGRSHTISNILLEHEEAFPAYEEDGETQFSSDWRALFYGRKFDELGYISIGPTNPAKQLTIVPTALNDEQTRVMERVLPDSENLTISALKIVYSTNEQTLPLFVYVNHPLAVNQPLAPTSPSTKWDRILPRGLSPLVNNDAAPAEIKCTAVGPELLNKGRFLRFWGRVVLTDDEERAVDALRLLYGTDVERVAVRDDNTIFIDPRQGGRLAIVKLKSHDSPVPLKSLGDGALRLFGIALALANSRNGFMLIDEAENGIHHSIQRDYWRMVLQTAHENNVQVLATTHSWDCVTGFAQAATELEDVEGVLVRLSRSNGELRAIEYPEEELAIAAEQGIEVR